MRRLLLTSLFLPMWWIVGCVPATPDRASAVIRVASGIAIGKAQFQPVGEDNVKVTVEVRGLTPGAHGIHVHEVGTCEPPGFVSAGAHFNPGGQAHHGVGEQSHHAGDLPNLAAGADGVARAEAVLRGITMQGRGHHSLFHLNGTSIVIHRDADDLKTAPSGNSGERIACGVVAADQP